MRHICLLILLPSQAISTNQYRHICGMPMLERSVLDLSAISSIPIHELPDNELEKMTSAINQAFQNNGLLIIKNHSVSNACTTRLQNVAKHFFDQATTREKAKCTYRAPVPRGYSGVSKENFAILAGERRPNDLVEKYRMGPMHEFVAGTSDKEDQMMYYPNKWPDADRFQIQDAMESYYREMEKLSLVLIHLFERALRLSEKFLQSMMEYHTSILSVNHYPSISKQIQKGQMRLAEHTDVDLFTIICPDQQDQHRCLQVLDSGIWKQVPVIPDTFIVNIGDGLEYWTQSYWKSARHRVVLPKVKNNQFGSRLSIGYFVGGCCSAHMTRMPFVSSDDWKMKDTTYSEWRRGRIKQAMKSLQLSER